MSEVEELQNEIIVDFNNNDTFEKLKIKLKKKNQNQQENKLKNNCRTS